mmetsp:Transcript_8230/g.17765  ORF Transcript_8230/g.17765 Transcript_8230/m.17765 type:complete len:217 (+) Transcript_8230:21-671(+)
MRTIPLAICLWIRLLMRIWMMATANLIAVTITITRTIFPSLLPMIRIHIATTALRCRMLIFFDNLLRISVLLLIQDIWEHFRFHLCPCITTQQEHGRVLQCSRRKMGCPSGPVIEYGIVMIITPHEIMREKGIPSLGSTGRRTNVDVIKDNSTKDGKEIPPCPRQSMKKIRSRKTLRCSMAVAEMVRRVGGSSITIVASQVLQTAMLTEDIDRNMH